MSLELAFKRLSIRQNTLCHQCRRTIASASRPQQQSEVKSLFETLEASPRTARATQRRPSPPLSSETTTASRPDQATAQRTSFDLANAAVRNASAGRVRQHQEEEQRQRDLTQMYSRAEYEAQGTRRWNSGDVYAPHDLSGVEMAKWKKNRRKGRQSRDVMDVLGMNPIEHYKNFTIMSEFVTDMGRIKHRNDTGLRPVNQRRMAKAIRRAIGTGLMPGVHQHPELMRIETAARNRDSPNGRAR